MGFAILKILIVTLLKNKPGKRTEDFTFFCQSNEFERIDPIQPMGIPLLRRESRDQYAAFVHFFRNFLRHLPNYSIVKPMAAKDPKIFLSIKDIEKEYPVPNLNPFKRGEKMKALKGLDLTIHEGTVCCVLGPNGAGKTTLIKILAGLILPDNGEIHMKGGKNSGVGLVTPNDRSFYWRLTGRQNLDFFASLYGMKNIRESVASVLEEVGMSEHADKPYRQYSAGMKQKINIARALLSDPDLYLLDEPANHLDPIAREEFRRFVKKTLLKKRGATVLLCTHDLDEAAELSDRIALLHEGKIVAQGDPLFLQREVRNQSHFLLKGDSFPESWLDANRDRILEADETSCRIKAGGEEISNIVETFLKEGGKLQGLEKEEARLMDIMKYYIGGNHV